MIIREPSIIDVPSLHQLILDSTNQQSKLTEANLFESLFDSNPKNGKLETKCIDGSVRFELELVESNTPAAKAFVAENQNRLIGYVLYRYHYSPWMGHSMFIVDTYVVPDHRKKNIARQLIDKVISKAIQEGLSSAVLTIPDCDSALTSYLLETHKLKWYRNGETDWSVYRLEC